MIVQAAFIECLDGALQIHLHAEVEVLLRIPAIASGRQPTCPRGREGIISEERHRKEKPARVSIASELLAREFV